MMCKMFRLVQSPVFYLTCSIVLRYLFFAQPINIKIWYYHSRSKDYILSPILLKRMYDMQLFCLFSSNYVIKYLYFIDFCSLDTRPDYDYATIRLFILYFLISDSHPRILLRGKHPILRVR